MKRWYFFVAKENGSDLYINGTIRTKCSRNVALEVVENVRKERGIDVFVTHLSRL